MKSGWLPLRARSGRDWRGSGGDRSVRADKLFSALSAKERALLVLRAWKEGGEEDRQVRATIPPDQGAEFNRYIELMKAANEGLGIYLVVMRANVEQLGLISGWLATIKLWSIHSFELGLFIFRNVPQPITASNYERLKRTSRRRNPRPDRGLKYEVFPDAQVKRVEQLAQERANIMNSFRRVPFGDFQDPDEAEPPMIELAYQALVERLKRQVSDYWRQLRAAEALLDEAAAIFGEDPAIPEIRAIVVWLRAELTSLHETVRTQYQQEVDLGGQDDEELHMMRKIAGWPKESMSGPRGNEQITVDMVHETIRSAMRASEDHVSGGPDHQQYNASAKGFDGR